MENLTIINTRTVSVMGVECTFQFTKPMEDIFNAAEQYYDVNRNTEAFRGISKAKGLVKLLSLSNDQFNKTFEGMFDINAQSFVASKIDVFIYAIKLMEASTATDPSSSAERFQMMMNSFMNAVASSIDAVSRNIAAFASSMDAAIRAIYGSIDAVVRCLDAERIERIAGQERHQALIHQNMIGIGKAHKRIDTQDEKIDALERQIKALIQAQPVSVRRSARKKTAREHET